MLLLCDFDGTITVRDLTNIVWDTCLRYDWRAELVPLSERGEINATEMIRRGYADVDRPAGEIVELIRPAAGFRDGFHELLEACHRRGWLFEVLSNGMRFYIEALLPPSVPIWAYEGQFDGRWRVELPAGVTLDATEDFKVKVLEKHRAEDPSRPVVYIGDGRLDFEAARRSDRVFAVDGSTLARLCARNGVPFTPFETFQDVLRALNVDTPRLGG